MELIIQKAVELGASTLLFQLKQGRCVVKLDAKKAQKKVTTMAGRFPRAQLSSLSVC